MNPVIRETLPGEMSASSQNSGIPFNCFAGFQSDDELTSLLNDYDFATEENFNVSCMCNAWPYNRLLHTIESVYILENAKIGCQELCPGAR